MATTENSYTKSNSNGPSFTFTFPYIKLGDVQVFVDDIRKTQDTHYEFDTATSIRFLTGSIPTTGQVIKIKRFTDVDQGPQNSFYTGSFISANSINSNFEQVIFREQELFNNVSALSSGEILDNSLNGSKLADNAVTTAKIADDAVETAKIAFHAVTQSEIAPNSISTAKIQDNAVTEAKISGNNGFVPTGAVFHFVASSVPAGYLKCNGDTIPNGSGTVQGVTADFSALYALTGGTLPDLRGEFIRGFDDGRGVDSGRSINTTQTDQNKQHNHTASATSTVTDNGHAHGVSAARSIGGHTDDGGQPDQRVTQQSFGTDIATTGITVATSVTVDNDGGSEARPRNVALLACIKY